MPAVWPSAYRFPLSYAWCRAGLLSPGRCVVLTAVPLSVSSIRSWYQETVGPLPTVAALDASSAEVSSAVALEALIPVVTRAQKYGAIPALGTPAWRDLAPGDPRRVGAVHLAAAFWVVDQEHVQHAADDAAAELAASGAASRAHRVRTDRADFYRHHFYLMRRSA